ncbi:MAG: hypothetical protein C5B55_09720 [Blastocatellia bacterium]|nr:MAG: hypothetical protein C5B55_09720 [Blastocatellia bacterium]
MTPIVRLGLLILASFAAAVCVCAQTQTRTNTQAETATVTGKVTIKGKPATGIVVMLRRYDGGNPLENSVRGTTDQAGVYRIADIPPSSYQLAVISPGYVITDSAEIRTRSLVLSAGETVTDINFSLVRGGVITGKVTDSEGHALVEQQVFIYRAESFNQNQNQRNPIYQAGSGTTDDRGIYRIFGIAAGQYKVAAGRSEDTYQGPQALTRAMYQQVFYPNVNDQSKATVIEVSEGSEATGIDISLGPAMQTFTASGRTVDGEKIIPLPNIRFGVQRIRGDRPEYVNMVITSNTQGDFLIENLLPGKYRVFMFPEPNNIMRADAVDFEVVDHDLTGLTVRISKGASISGVIVVEPEERTSLSKITNLNIGAYVSAPGAPGGIGQGGSSTVGPDGTFTISGLPAGMANISLYSRTAPNTQAWMVTRIERDGVVQPRAFEIKDGEQIVGLRVIVAHGTATLRGVVSFTNGELPPAGRIGLRLSKPGEQNQFMRPTQVDARGHFISEGLIPGTYDLIVSVVGPNLKPRIVKQQVTLTDNTITDVTVTVDFSSQPTPQP